MPPIASIAPVQTSSPALDPEDFPETHSVGSRSTERRLSAQTCPVLLDNGVNLAGISDATEQFRFVRWNPNFLQVLVTTGGLGEVLVDGRWMEIPPGRAYVTPPGQLHAYHTSAARRRWEVCWIIMRRGGPIPLPMMPEKPRLVETDPDIVRSIVLGAFSESVGKSDPAMMENWARLLRLLATRIVGSAPRDEVIDMLWKKVATRLAHPWTLAELSGTLGCSEEHLRRLCQRRYACSPRKRLLSLRMQHAASLLSGTNLTIAAIAEQVGYENEFAFSNAFKRWSHGTPPSIYRKRVHEDAPKPGHAYPVYPKWTNASYARRDLTVKQAGR